MAAGIGEIQASLQQLNMEFADQSEASDGQAYSSRDTSARISHALQAFQEEQSGNLTEKLSGILGMPES